MKTSAIIAGTSAAFLTAAAATAPTLAQEQPEQRYEILDGGGWQNFYIHNKDDSIESFQSARTEDPDSFATGAFSFYYNHIKDHQTGDDILCSGALIIAPTLEEKDLYPEILVQELYTTSSTAHRLLIPGEYIDDNIKQYGSCMSVDGSMLEKKDFYILQPGRANGLHEPVLKNEPVKLTYELKEEYEAHLWGSKGWNREIRQAQEASKNGEITGEEFGEIGETILYKYLKAMQTYLDREAYGTHNNTVTCPHAGYMGETLHKISHGTHDGSDLPLCGALSFD